MELTLNLIWLVISIASIAYGIRRVTALAPGAARRRFAVHASFALGCALLLLFPVISITDDLHWDSVAAEEWSAIRRGPGFAAAHLSQHPCAPVTLALVLPTLVEPHVFLYGVDSAPAPFAAAIPDHRSNPRSPPFAL